MKGKKRFLFVGMITAVLAISTAVYAATRGPGRGGVAASVGAPANAGASASGSCKTLKSEYVTNDTTGLSTTSTSYVAVPGMSKTITIAGTAPSCVIVDVAGFAYAPGGALEYVSVLLDSSTGPSPTETQFTGDDKGVYAGAHAGNFVFPSVSAGTHTITIVFRSLDGKTVYLHRPSAIITHR